MDGFDNQEIASVFQNIDMLIVPSLWQENSPLVIQEAFLAETPVIASRLGGIPEIVQNGINGLLFNPGDVDELREKMQQIINNPSLIEKFRENMPKIRCIEDNAKEIEEIYNKLVIKGKTELIS